MLTGAGDMMSRIFLAMVHLLRWSSAATVRVHHIGRARRREPGPDPGPGGGIILHYPQTTLNESFVLPLRPLTGAGAAEKVPRSRRSSHVALVTAA